MKSIGDSMSELHQGDGAGLDVGGVLIPRDRCGFSRPARPRPSASRHPSAASSPRATNTRSAMVVAGGSDIGPRPRSLPSTVAPTPDSAAELGKLRIGRATSHGCGGGAARLRRCAGISPEGCFYVFVFLLLVCIFFWWLLGCCGGFCCYFVGWCGGGGVCFCWLFFGILWLCGFSFG